MEFKVKGVEKLLKHSLGVEKRTVEGDRVKHDADEAVPAMITHQLSRTHRQNIFHPISERFFYGRHSREGGNP